MYFNRIKVRVTSPTLFSGLVHLTLDAKHSRVYQIVDAVVQSYGDPFRSYQLFHNGNKLLSDYRVSYYQLPYNAVLTLNIEPLKVTL